MHQNERGWMSWVLLRNVLHPTPNECWPQKSWSQKYFWPRIFFFYQIDNLDKNDILYSKFFWAKKIILDSKFCCANDIIGRINFFGAKKILTQIFLFIILPSSAPIQAQLGCSWFQLLRPAGQPAYPIQNSTLQA